MIVAAIQCCGAFAWVKSAEGGSSTGVGIAADAHGHSYVIGNFSGTILLGSNSLTSAGGSDIFIAKLKRNGEVAWAISAGSVNDDTAQTIDATPNGPIFVTGTFGTNGSIGGIEHTGGTFLAKLSRHGDGGWLHPLTNIASRSTALDQKRQHLWLATSRDGRLAFVRWDKDGTEFPPVITDAVPVSRFARDKRGNFLAAGGQNFGRNISVTKISEDGRAQWTNSISLTYSAYPVEIGVSRDGSATIVGNTSSPGYPNPAIFGASFNSIGGQTDFGLSYEYKGVRRVNGMTIDPRDRQFAVGNFNSSYAGSRPNYRGGSISGPGFYIIITNTQRFSWIPDYTLGTINPAAIAVDQRGRAYVIGDYSGTAIFDTHRLGKSQAGPSQVFFARIDDAKKRAPEHH
jgi:hypothetical protein